MKSRRRLAHEQARRSWHTKNDEDDLLVSVLWKYSKIAGCPIDQILYDNLEVTFRDLQVV